MGILFMATADLQSLALWSSTLNAALSTAQARTGTRSFYMTSSGSLQKNLDSVPSYGRVAVMGVGSVAVTLALREGSTTHLNLYVNFAAGTIAVRRDTTVLATAALGLSAGVWYAIEFYGVVHDTAGVAVVKCNGVTVLNLSGLDTRNGGTGVVDNFQISGSSANQYYIDDVILRDDAWPGRGGIYVLTPTGAGANADLTPSAGDAYACVDELPATFDDYLSGASDDTGAVHDLALSALPAGLEVFGGVGVVAYARLASAGSGALNVGYIDTPGSEAQYSADGALSQSGQWVSGYFAKNAGAGDFTATQIGRLTAALKIAAEPA